MSYMALYRKWRPVTFDQVVEQENAVSILKNAVIQNRIAHAYLFSGTRGTGKTTLAKIFARAINCQHPVNGNPCNECEICRGIMNQQILDVSEIDAASNNGVDNIRQIIDDSAYASSVARYRVYIIDEVHMLSQGAFNALLKTLEEPPENVVFILATTEPHKLPVTILSRCQRYEFKRISREGITKRLRLICSETGIDATDEALEFLAEKADGALRDAISLLDQATAAGGEKLTLAKARDATGSIDREFLWDFAGAVLNSDSRRLLEMSHRLFTEGRDPSNFLLELTGVIRNMMIVNSVPDPGTLLFEDEEGIRRLKLLAKGHGNAELSLLIQELSRLDNNLKWAVQRQIVFEAGILTVSDRKWGAETASVESRLTAVEEMLAGLRAGNISLPAAAESAAVSEPAVAAPVEQAAPEEAAVFAPVPEAVKEAAPEVRAEAVPEEKTEARTETAPQAANSESGVRKLAPGEWDSILSEMRSRGNSSMLTWFSDSVEQYLFSDSSNPQLVALFDDEMCVNILNKSSENNLKPACEAVRSVLGRAYKLQFVLKDGFKVPVEAKTAAPAVSTAPAMAAPAAATIAPAVEAAPAQEPAAPAAVKAAEPAAPAATQTAEPAAPQPAESASPADVEPSEDGSNAEAFRRGADYFRMLAQKLDIRIDEN